jgi:type II secretory pathway component GspD/PulD (secretin)
VARKDEEGEVERLALEGKRTANGTRARVWVAFILAVLVAVPAWAQDESPMDPFAPITLSVKDQELQDVLSLLSRSRGLNIVSSGDVTGRVSIDLTDVPFHDALHSVVAMAGFDVTEKDGIFFIHKPDGTDQSAAVTVDSRTFRLNYALPSDLLPVVTQLLSPFGEAIAYEPLRALVVEDLPHIIARVDRLLDGLDTAPRQVLIEAQILEARLTDDFRYGLDWSLILSDGSGEGSLDVSGFTGGPTSGFDGAFVTWADGDFTSALEAHEGISELRTLAAPRVVVVDGTEADIMIGGQLGFPVSRQFENTLIQSVEFLDTGTQLIVTPTISDDGFVRLAIHPELSDGQVQEGLPSKTTTEVSTEVLVRDGSTLVIGGLIRTREERSRRGIPLLVRIPVIGALFGRTVTSSQRSEIITLIRPRILRPGEATPDGGYRLFDSSELQMESPVTTERAHSPERRQTPLRDRLAER